MNKLGDLTVIKTNFATADFWLIRKGSIKTVGSAVRKFNPEHIGIKVVEVEILLPDYLYFAMKHVRQQKHWERLAVGTLSLVHIRVQDVKNIELY